MKKCAKVMGNAVQTIRVTFLNIDSKEYVERKMDLYHYIHNEKEVKYRKTYIPKGDFSHFCLTFRAEHNSIKMILSNISKIFKKEVIKVEIISREKAYALYSRKEK